MSNYPKLIAFTGLAGAGKSTAAEFFRKEMGYVEESFAKRGKLGVQAMFNLPDSNVFGDKDQKEQTIPSLSIKKPITGRFLMQTMMTDWARDIVDPDIWIYAVASKFNTLSAVPGFRGMVISDLRFDNEAEWVIKQGGIVIEVITTDKGVKIDNHVSENGINYARVAFTVCNSKQTKTSFTNSLVVELENWLMAVQKTKITATMKEVVKFESLRDLIVKWADKVHPDRTIMNAIQKMVYEEIPEYLLAQDDPLELADIGILLYDIANLAGIDLEQAIRDKMAINKKRDWKISDKTGLMSHVADDEPLRSIPATRT